MKKTLTASMIVFTVMVCVAPCAEAATDVKGPIVVAATVSSQLSLTVVMKRNNFAGATINSMNFGNLIDSGSGITGSNPSSTTGTGAVDVFLSANTQGAPYSIMQTGTPMSNGTTILPDGACIVKPIYDAADNGGLAMPAGASLGTGGTFTSASPKLLYQSEGGVAQARTVQALYSITDDPAAGATADIPVNQGAGTYSSTVTYTLVA